MKLLHSCTLCVDSHQILLIVFTHAFLPLEVHAWIRFHSVFVLYVCFMELLLSSYMPIHFIVDSYSCCCWGSLVYESVSVVSVTVWVSARGLLSVAVLLQGSWLFILLDFFVPVLCDCKNRAVANLSPWGIRIPFFFLFFFFAVMHN